ncbi:MAG: Flp family type IVb pilin [Proteobacteria bacterium]|nr:Flp family type IVb pilin [Pseudomonadota bacterium]
MRTQFQALWAGFIRDEVGGPAVEYSLVAALIAMTLLTGLLMMNSRIGSTYSIISTNLDTQ